MKTKNLIGLRFGKLEVKKIAENYVRKDGRNSTQWFCLCDCGKGAIVRASQLKNGVTKSCGCIRSEKAFLKSFKHGLSKTRISSSWNGMKSRCYNKNNPKYKSYGARGIIVCDRWLKSIENFYKDMGDPPTSEHSIDRINNNGNYEPANCQWATRLVQNRNQRTNILIEVNFRKMTVSEACQSFKLPQSSLNYAMKKHKILHQEAFNQLILSRGLRT